MTEVFRAYLSVTSRTLSLADIEQALDLRSHPDGWSLGGPGGKNGPNPREWTSWKSPLDLDPSLHAGTEGLDAALAELTDDLADRLATCKRCGCYVALCLVQDFDEDVDHNSTGLCLAATSIRWLARARGDLDVDQYR